MKDLQLFIELNKETGHHDVVVYNNGEGSMRWFTVFSGDMPECTYFKDNMAKGLRFILEDEE